MNLIKENNLGPHADDIYTHLMDAVQGMTTDQIIRFNTRLVLLLVNQVGDPSIIREAVQIARTGINDK